MAKKTLLGIEVDKYTKKDILEKIIKVSNEQHNFFHVVSLNPENLIISLNDKLFKSIIATAQIKLIDGVGVAMAAQLLRIEAGERYTGVDLMSDMLQLASKIRLRALLIGGRPNLADKLAKCYQQSYPQSKFIGVEGINNINFQKKVEEEEIFAIVRDLKPNFVFVAFGSPAQEIWLDRHKEKFANCICMGVGGGFDFLSGKINRAPKIIRSLGLEWLYRLLLQPWRWQRQLRLIEFSYLVLRQKIGI